MSTPQELLDQITAINIRNIFVPELPKKGRLAAIKLAKQHLKSVKQLSHQEQALIKTGKNMRNKSEAQATRIELLPYMAIDRVVADLEDNIATLIYAVETDSPLPEPPILGTELVREFDGQTITYKIADAESAQELREQQAAREREVALQKTADVNAQMLEAKRLIEQGAYGRAHSLLLTIDHPKANEWLSFVSHKITAASSVAQSSSTTIQMVCPKCKKQPRFVVTGNVNYLDCPECHTPFTARIYTVRAKRSNKREVPGRRFYSVRVYDERKAEDVIEFVDGANRPEIEMRAKDLVGFVYLDDKVAIVQNFTLGRYSEIRTSDCYIATFLYGENSSEVAILREFRDEDLLSSYLLSFLVSAYYSVSPILIKYFGGHVVFRQICQIAISPVVHIAMHKHASRTPETPRCEQ